MPEPALESLAGAVKLEPLERVMNRNPRLILLALFVAAPGEASGLGFFPAMLFIGPKATAEAPEAVEINRMNRSRFDRTVPFVISQFDRKVIDEFSRAWIGAGGGLSASERVVLMLRMAGGGYSARLLPPSNERNSFTFAWHPATVAVVHTHPNRADARPQPQDIAIADKYRVPIFTLTNRGMFVYDPQFKTTRIVKSGLDWIKASNWQAAPTRGH